jgi:hypothetical protein
VLLFEREYVEELQEAWVGGSLPPYLSPEGSPGKGLRMILKYILPVKYG